MRQNIYKCNCIKIYIFVNYIHLQSEKVYEYILFIYGKYPKKVKNIHMQMQNLLSAYFPLIYAVIFFSKNLKTNISTSRNHLNAKIDNRGNGKILDVINIEQEV